jgi:hypothetical protein
MQNFQDSFEVQKKEEIEHERRKAAAAAAEDRKQADANHKIELGYFQILSLNVLVCFYCIAYLCGPEAGPLTLALS